jgi:purine-binding chemotaxis protein CheW
MQYLTFLLDKVEYAVDVRIIETVVPFEGATPVPSSLPYMRGVMELRGSVVPLIDLRKKLSLGTGSADSGTSVIVFGVGDLAEAAAGITVGAIVDGVSEVVSMDEGELETSKGTGAVLWEPYILGVARYEGRMIVIIRPSGLFSLDELAAMRAA